MVHKQPTTKKSMPHCGNAAVQPRGGIVRAPTNNKNSALATVTVSEGRDKKQTNKQKTFQQCPKIYFKKWIHKKSYKKIIKYIPHIAFDQFYVTKIYKLKEEWFCQTWRGGGGGNWTQSWYTCRKLWIFCWTRAGSVIFWLDDYVIVLLVICRWTDISVINVFWVSHSGTLKRNHCLVTLVDSQKNGPDFGQSIRVIDV